MTITTEFDIDDVVLHIKSQYWARITWIEIRRHEGRNYPIYHGQVLTEKGFTMDGVQVIGHAIEFGKVEE